MPPVESELYRFGSGVLGYDCYGAKPYSELALESIDKAERQTLMRDARRYGFHATLKAPFYLRAGATESALLSALETFAAARKPLLPMRLKLDRLGNFAALVPQEASEALNRLAADSVEDFDRFRAPLSDVERSKRMAANLNARQTSYLNQFGYPFVHKEFRFHMTLTGPLPDAKRDRIIAELRRNFSDHVRDLSMSIGTLSIAVQQSSRSGFRVLHQCTLGNAAVQGAGKTVGDLQRRISDEWA